MISVALLLGALNAAPVGVEKIGSNCYFYTPVQGRNGLVNRWEISDGGAASLGVLRELEIRSLKTVDGSEATGFGPWNALPMAGTYQNYVHWSKVPGSYAEITFDINPGEVVGLVNFKSTNGGIGRVTIDGRPDLADQLPQDGNGNRVVDFYSASGSTPNVYCRSRRVIPVAQELLPGPHTIRLEVTGQKNPSSSDVRVMLDALAIYRKDATEDDTVGSDFCVLNSTPLTAPGAWETVFRINGKFYGTNQHGSENVYSASVAMDSIPLNLNQYEFRTGSTLTVDVDTDVVDVKLGVLAENRRVYTFTPEGLDLGLQTKWINPQPVSLAYQAMFPVLDGPEISSYAVFKSGTRSFSNRAILDLSVNTGDMRGGFNARTAVLYNKNHPRMFTMEMTDLDSNLTDPKFFVWDLAAPSYNKLYFQRQIQDYVPAVGEVWQATAKYRCSYDALPSGY